MNNQHEQYNTKGEFNQQGRLIPELLPDTIAVDDRNQNELIRYIVKIAKLFNYYDDNNNLNGDWEDFFISDASVLYRIVASLNLNDEVNKYQNIINGFKFSVDEQIQMEQIHNSFKILIELANKVGRIKRGVNHLRFDAFFISAFNTAIEKFDFTTKLNQLRKLIEQYNERVKSSDLPELDGIFNSEKNDEKRKDENEDGNYTNATDLHEKLNKIFLCFKDTLSIIISNATYQLRLKINDKQVKPHLTLIYVFLELYKYLQNEINQLPKKHLTFYFKEYLNLKPQKAKSDSAFLLLKPAVNAPASFLLGKNNLFRAEPKSSEPEYLYELAKEVIISNSSIARLHTVFVDNTSKRDLATSNEDEPVVYIATPPLLSADEIIAKKKISQSWPIVGESQENFIQSKRNMEPANIGFLLASPLFYKTNGGKLFTCKFYFSDIQNQKQTIISDILRIFITTKTGWQEIEKKTIVFEVNNKAQNDKSEFKNKDSNSAYEKVLRINFKIKAGEQTDLYNEQVHRLGLNERRPVVKFQLNPNANESAYGILKNINVKRVKLIVEVTKAKIDGLRNSTGNIDSSLPFQVFGPVPVVGSYLEFHSTNIFNKFIKKSTICIEWLNLPKDNLGFQQYYNAYSELYKNDSFKVGAYNLSEKKEPDVKEVYNLFKAKGKYAVDGALDDHSHFEIYFERKIRFDNPMLLEKDKQSVDKNSTVGVLRLELVAPESAFGNNEYPQLFSETILYNAKKRKKKQKRLPSLPYLPIANSVEIDYTLEQSESMHQADDTIDEENGIKLYHLYPFGYRKTYPSYNTGIQPLIPVFDKTANLYIGLQNVQPKQQITLFFEVDEVNSDNQFNELAQYEWNYLVNNSWREFEKENILKNSTLNFLRSGIVILELPDITDSANTILPESLFWIRLSLNSNTAHIPRVFRILNNVVEVVRQEVKGTDKLLTLPEGSITDLLHNEPKIETICQFNQSFNGRMAETEMQYYRRVSEMLNHKNRAITVKDIASLVLQKFPQITFIKCITPHAYRVFAEREFCHLKFIVIPARDLFKEQTDYQPCVNALTIREVKKFIQRNIPDHLQIQVVNPVYEKIKVICRITIDKGKYTETEGYYQQKLNEALRRFISPWLFEDAESCLQNNLIYLIDILNFIKEQPYIHKVLEFSVLHIHTKDVLTKTNNMELTSSEYVVLRDSALEQIEYIKPSNLNAIVVTSQYHYIELDFKEETTNDKWADAEHHIQTGKPKPSGIGRLIIGEDLIVDNNESKSNINIERIYKPAQLYNFTIK